MNESTVKYRFEYAVIVKSSMQQEPEHAVEKKEVLIHSIDKQRWINYRKLVWKITEKQPLKKLNNFNQRSFLGYHLDHKVSIWYGFKNKIDPNLIGSIHNLEFIPHKENMIKGRRCNFENNRAIQTTLYV